MFELQEIFTKQIEELASPKSVLLQILNQRFEELGMPLTTSQQDDLAQQILEITDGTIHIEFEDDQITKAGFCGEKEIEPLIRKIFDGLVEDIAKYISDFEETLPDVLQKTIKDIAPIILKSLKERASEMLIGRRSERDSFGGNLSATWGEAIDLLEMYLVISLETGEYINNVSRPTAVDKNDLVFDVLTRLHARACQISWEILTLLENGFADGAHARWRSLHEVTVVANFIAKSGNGLAERYLLHEKIESYKAALQYRKYCGQLGLEEIADDEMGELLRIRDELIKRFGSDYKHEYGWASEALGKKRPTFRDIEEAVDLNHLRPYYKMASYNVHANPKGVFFKLGIIDCPGDLLLAGPSNIGLTEPGHSMALSLGNITICLLIYEPTVDKLVISNILLELCREVGDAFFKAHNALIESDGG